MKALTPRPLTTAVAALTLGCAFSAPLAVADNNGHGHKGVITTDLSGYNEVHFVSGPPAALRGAISTKGTGRFRAAIDDAKQLIHYELHYSGLEGNVTQAHIHFGQRHTVGGIVVWLCQTAANPAPPNASTTPVCPPNTSGGPVTGTVDATEFTPQPLQGINAGEFGEVIRAIRAGTAYVNVHSSLHPPGEIRGHLDRRGHHD